MALLKLSDRRSIMILVSVSLISLVFSSLPLLFRSLNQFSINKSYVFLFCNGLMAFIAKNSSLPSSDSSSDHHQFKDLGVAEPAVYSQEHDNMVAANSPEPEVEEEEKRMIVAKDSHEEDEVAADTEKDEDEVADAEKEWVDNTEIEEEEEEEGSDINNGVWIREEEEEEHEEVEELNKKCEDFIRKMKAAFCSEPSYSSYHVYSDADDHHTAMVTVR